MSGKPQKSQGDILDEIMGRDPAYGGAPPGEPDVTAPEAPAAQEESASAQEEKAGEKAPPSEKRNRRSAAYIYLLILFGAAFLMLLLAYFIQQRNSETTISDLKDSMNLSREELMDEIEALEAEKEQLNAAIQESEIALEQEKQQREVAETMSEMFSARAGRRFVELERTTTLAWLERFCTEGDWLMAAAVVEADDFFFNEKNGDYERNWAEEGREATPVQAAWYLALREEVFDNAGCMMMLEEESPAESSIAFTERPYIDPTSGRYDEETVNTAKNLWVIISSYSINLADDIPSTFSFLLEKVMAFHTEGDIERLNGGAFQPSTVEVLEQITQELIDQGLIIGTGVDTEDGTIHLGTAQVEVPESWCFT